MVVPPFVGRFTMEYSFSVRVRVRSRAAVLSYVACAQELVISYHKPKEHSSSFRSLTNATNLPDIGLLDTTLEQIDTEQLASITFIL